MRTIGHQSLTSRSESQVCCGIDGICVHAVLYLNQTIKKYHLEQALFENMGMKSPEKLQVQISGAIGDL